MKSGSGMRRWLEIPVLLTLACGDGRSTPDAPPVQSLAVLDSALAIPGMVVEYHWEAPDRALPGLSATAYRHPLTPTTVYLADTVAFALDGVTAARVDQGGLGFMVVLELTVDAGGRLLHTTSWHVNERIGVVVNGYLLTLATVRAPLTNMLPVVDLVPADQARALAERINARLSAR